MWEKLLIEIALYGLKKLVKSANNYLNDVDVKYVEQKLKF